MCALLAFVFTGLQPQALPLDTTITIGNFSSAMKKINPKITDDEIYSEYFKVDDKSKTWTDLLKPLDPKDIDERKK
ncbi:MAG: hypothetical protein FJX00_02295 [Alphaproteobacteria bacterium]|nr:hypothetical protein [Alphaproteobacteria bacterium]